VPPTKTTKPRQTNPFHPSVTRTAEVGQDAKDGENAAAVGEEEQRAARRWAAWRAKDEEQAAFDPQRAQEWVKAWERNRAGDGSFLATLSTVGLGAFVETVECSPLWKTARSKPEGKLLWEVATLLNQLSRLVHQGLEYSNSATALPVHQKERLGLAIRVAKLARRHLGRHLPYNLPREHRLNQKMIDADRALDCVRAWLKAVKMIAAAKLRSPTVIAAALAKLEKEDPILAWHLHGPTDRRSGPVVTRTDGRDDASVIINRAPPTRATAFELARRSLGLHGAKAVKDAYEYGMKLEKVTPKFDADCVHIWDPCGIVVSPALREACEKWHKTKGLKPPAEGKMVSIPRPTKD